MRLADRADDVANPGSVDPAAASVAVVVAVALRGAAVHADGFAPARRAAGPDPAAFFDLAVRADDFVPSVVAVECVAGPDSVGHADDFVPSVVAVPGAADPDSAAFFDLAVRAGDSDCADLIQLAALPVGLHAAAVVPRAVGRLVAGHSGVDSGAPVDPAVAVPRCDGRPVRLVAGLADPGWAGADLAVPDSPGYGLA